MVAGKNPFLRWLEGWEKFDSSYFPASVLLIWKTKYPGETDPIGLMLFIPEGGRPQFHLIILINNVCSYCITQKRRRNKRPKGVLRFCMWSVFFCQPVLMSISHYVPYNIIFTLALKVSKIWKWRSSKVWRYFEEVIKHLIRRPGNTMVKREIHIINDRHKTTQET
jgi:hypothetical protein